MLRFTLTQQLPNVRLIRLFFLLGLSYQSKAFMCAGNARGISVHTSCSTCINTAFPRTTTLPRTMMSSKMTPLTSTSLTLGSAMAVEPISNIAYPLPEERFNVTLPVYWQLMSLTRGEYETSAPFTTTGLDGRDHTFRVLIYPRGGASLAKSKPVLGDQKEEDETTGFGMSYKILPLMGKQAERVGVYLQYLPDTDDDIVDVTFDLRLKGQQTSGRKFDVEHSAGMRFTKEGKLSEGTASDFGAHLMQTPLLEAFMGAEQGNEIPLQVEVRLTVHPESSSVESEENSISDKGNQLLAFNDIRFSPNGLHNVENVRVGKVVVPLLQRLKERPRMFEVGAYPGVEYRILRILSKDGHEIFGSAPGASYELKPIYPLVDALERQWPVRVEEEDIPKLLTANMYNLVSALGSLFTAAFGLFTAFVLSQFISLFFIPSRSMDPTLQIGDVLVVEKVSARILKGNNHKGGVVLFHPPSLLQQIVSANGGRITDRDLFVKRVAAEPGDIVKVDSAGGVTINGLVSKERRDLCEAEPLKLIEKYVKAGETEVKEGEVFVLGDCSSVSVDSRVWGPLSNNEIVGKPLIRAWPLDRFGSISTLPVQSADNTKETE